MGLKYLLVDDTTGKRKRGSSPGGASGFVDQDFDVGVGGQTFFTVSQTFTVSSTLDVLVNGRKVRESATIDFVRNTSFNRIEFNYTVPQYAWVQVRVWL